MAIELYDLTVPVLTRGLDRLLALLDKGEAHALARGMAPEELVDARLAPDMLTLAGQVQRAADTAKFAAVRIGGAENVAFPDEERSFADLRDRIARTQAFLAAVPRAAIDRRAGETMTARIGQAEITLPVVDYALRFALPNFFFHLTTAYDILRMKGVPLSKRDFIGSLDREA